MQLKPTNKTFAVDEEITISMHQPTIGKFPIGRAETGIVCKLNPKNPKQFFEYGSTWSATVSEVHEKFLVVVPNECLKTKAAEEFETEQKIMQNFGKKKQERKRKDKINYQFHSKNG